jgi:ABC-type polysaccharide/polyol phosphate export permease
VNLLGIHIEPVKFPGIKIYMPPPRQVSEKALERFRKTAMYHKYQSQRTTLLGNSEKYGFVYIVLLLLVQFYRSLLIFRSFKRRS